MVEVFSVFRLIWETLMMLVPSWLHDTIVYSPDRVLRFMHHKSVQTSFKWLWDDWKADASHKFYKLIRSEIHGVWCHKIMGKVDVVVVL